jgi:putative heme-binding domain-containing protein
LGGRGAVLGPDLTNVAARFGRREILESILLPSKVIDDKYRNWTLEVSDGRTITGQFAGVDAESLTVAPDLLQPAQVVRVPRSAVVRRRTSGVSPMPEGLVDVNTAAEILDLLAYIEAGGKKEHRCFQP